MAAENQEAVGTSPGELLGNPALASIHPGEVLEMARAAGVEMVDFRFVDLPGRWHNFSVPLKAMNEDVFRDGLGFDGSSISGFQPIHESDMILIPDPDSATIDPVLKVPTLYMVCNVVDPLTKKAYTRDPRYIAQKAEAHLARSGIADLSNWGPEPEFYIFNGIRFDQNTYSSNHAVESLDTGRSKEAYATVAPTDNLQDLRSEIALKLIKADIAVEVHHHEVGTAGQAEVDIRFTTMTRMADILMLCKYVIKNVCKQHGYVATFMPKPLYEENGSGMHTHQSLWKGGQNLFFARDGYAQLSQEALWYIGGLLEHAPALLAFCAPTTNSYRRLVPGYEAPVNLIYSQRNRSACVRIPMYSTDPTFKRIEFRSPDASCNPYLAFAAMLMAGLDGIKRKIDPAGKRLDKDLYALTSEEKKTVNSVPTSLAEALEALEQDVSFLREGNVFTPDVLNTWIEYKQKRDVEPINHRPHPWEFYLYHDV